MVDYVYRGKAYQVGEYGVRRVRVLSSGGEDNPESSDESNENSR